LNKAIFRINSCTLKKTSPLLFEFTRFIKASKTGRRRKPDGNRLGAGTVDTYRNCQRLLTAFSTRQGQSLEIDITLKMSPVHFRSRKQYWQRFYRQFSDYLYAKGYYDNYVSNIFKIIRTFFRYLHHQYGWLDYQFLPHQWIRAEQVGIVVISPERLRFLLNDEAFYKQLTKRQVFIRDLMITGCFTALRASDLLTLDKQQLVSEGIHTWLVVNAKKTHQQSRILLPVELVRIFNKYPAKGKRIFPSISNANFNLQLKIIGQLAGWTEPVICQRNKMGIPLTVRNSRTTDHRYRFCDLLTTHTLRRSAITVLLMMGMPEQLVRQVSGHRPGSREFHRYVCLSQNWQDKESKMAFERLMRKEES
jgi:integrase